ncbi:MAG: response regulator transcription factor [Terriglobia bacterium]
MTKVLVVDDDTESRELLAEVLSTNGYSVGVVENNAAARELLREDEDYRIVIADLRMPNGSGLELLKDLRRQNSPHEVILMSSFMSSTERRLALDLGVDALVEKPYQISELLAVVAGLAQEKSLRTSP